MTKENVKTIALSACVSIITSLITVSMMTDTKSAIERKQVVLAPTVSSNQAVAEDEPTKGGLYDVTTTDGKTLKVKVPDDMYEVSKEYVGLILEGKDVEIKNSSNIVVASGSLDIPTSRDVVTITPHSTVKGLYVNIYGEDIIKEVPDVAWSPAYRYSKEGKLPEDLVNGSVIEIDKVVKDDIEFTVYDVSYETPITIDIDAEGNKLPEEEITTEYVNTSYLIAIHDGEDPIEIEIYNPEEDNNTKLALLKEILQIN